MSKRMLKWLMVFTILLTAGAAIATVSRAEEPAKVAITALWARPSIGNSQVGAGYFTVENKGPADVLLAVEADVSKTVELHTMTMNGLVMKMRRIENAPVPANGSLVFAPGGNHIMFIGLKKPLTESDSFPVTFVFEKAGRIAATMKVKNPGAAATPAPPATPSMSGMTGMGNQ